MLVRPAEASELDHLARVWHDAWHEAHGALAPAGLLAARTVDTFRARLAVMLDDTRVIGPPDAPLGLCVIKDDELHQLFVARAARGTGVAVALIDDGEARLAARGIATAWLSCAVGNNRAARFYDKRGWTNARTMMNRLETEQGVFEVPIWRYEKRVTAD
jgi:GNAT superfamily N-acetyltransferase